MSGDMHKSRGERPPIGLALNLPAATLEQLVRAVAPAVAELLAADDRQPAEDGYLTPADAARYLGLTRKRVYDLTSMRALEPDGRDGRTPLYRRETLDGYVRRAA